MNENLTAGATPLVSVVVACCNRPEFARESIASVLGQTYRHVEVVVQDDSTTDAVGKVVAGFGDERIVYTRNRPGKQGAGRNSIAGYRKARGKYLSTLNDDDLYEPNYLEIMVGALEAHPECVMAFCDHTIMDADGVLVPEDTERNTKHWGRDRLREGVQASPLEMVLIAKSVPGQFAVLRRSELELEDFPEEVSTAYDYWLTYLALRGGKPAYYVPQRLTHYRVHAVAETAGFSDPGQMLRAVAFTDFIHERMLADGRLAGINRGLLPWRAELRATEGVAHLRRGERGAAARAFARSLRLSVSRRAAMGLALCATPGALAQRLLRR